MLRDRSQTKPTHNGTFTKNRRNLNYAYLTITDLCEAEDLENSIQNVYDESRQISLWTYNNRLYVFYTSTAGQKDSVYL